MMRKIRTDDDSNVSALTVATGREGRGCSESPCRSRGSPPLHGAHVSPSPVTGGGRRNSKFSFGYNSPSPKRPDGSGDIRGGRAGSPSPYNRTAHNRSSCSVLRGGSSKSIRGSPRASPAHKFINTNRDPLCLALRKRVIQGDFMNGSYDYTRLERNILINEILPTLRDEGTQSDIEVTFVDMRWGVRDVHTLKHQTWLECQKELQRCRDESCGLFFLSLQSEKYGYRPLPRCIDKHAFERAVSASNQEVKDLAELWFQLDENSIVPHYVLRDLVSLDDSAFWNNALPKLRDAFVGIRFDKTLTTNVILGRSISEWEAKFSLITNEDCARSLWVHRSFNDAVENDKFADTTQDLTISSKLKDLKKWMNHKIKQITPHRIHNYTDISFDSYLSEKNLDFDTYAKDMKDNTLEALQIELRNIVKVKEEFDADGCGMNLPGYLLEEFLHHANWAYNLCASFIGREKLVAEGLALANAPNGKYEDSRAVVARTLLNGGIAHTYKSISFIVMGAPGVGKSAFMAVLANELFKLNNCAELKTSGGRSSDRKALLADPPLPKRLVLIRFCGTGDGTTSTHSLMASLVSQIEYAYNPLKPPRKRSKKSVERTFRELVNTKPVVIIIDGIDKILGGMEMFENLSIHNQTRIIVSVTTMKDKSNLTLFALENEVPFLEIKPYTTLSTRLKGEDAETALIIDGSLRRKGRKLSPEQRQFVLDKVETDPRAIYLSLVLREVDKWQSFQVLQEDLQVASFTNGMMDQILDKVELDCGKVMSRLAIGCLTLSVNGINDIEMEDLVSLDSEVLYAVFQYDYPAIWRLPSHVWLRLRNSLIGLIVERQRGCLHWHHEELQVIACNRFTSKDEKDHIHRILGTYFSNRVFSDTLLKGRISQQPLRINGISPFLMGANINTRRCNEGAYHLIEGGMYVEAVEEMCNIEYVAACLLSGEGYGLVSRFERLVGHFKRINADEKAEKPAAIVTKRLTDYHRWLSAKYDAINTDATALLLSVTASMEPVDSDVRIDLIALVKSTRNDKEAHKFSKDSWIRGVTLHTRSEGLAPPVYKNYNSCAVWSPDSNHIATCVGNDAVDIWDSKEMTVVGHLVCSTKQPLLQLSWACDNMHLAISSRLTVFIWDWKGPNGKGPKLIKTLGVNNTDRVCVGRFSPTAFEIACGSPNRTITLWGGTDFSLQKTYTTSKMSTKLSKHKVALPDITEVNWSSDGQKISALTPGNLRIWDRSELVTKATFTPAHGSRISSCDFSPDGNRLVTTSEDGKVTVWNTLTTAQHSVFEQHRDRVRCVSWHKDGVLIATGSKDGIVLVWNVLTGEVVHHLFGHYHDLHDLSWSPDGLHLLSASSNDHYIKWDSTKNGGRESATRM